MSRTFTDNELRLALMTYYDAVADASMPKPGQQFEYSPEHLTRMEGLMRRHEKRQRRILTLQRVAVFLLAFILTAATWLAVDVHARETFFNWVRTVYEDHIEYRFYGSPSPALGELPAYELGWIPDGFELVEEDLSSKVYENPVTGDAIVFDYSIHSELVQVSDYSNVEAIVIDQLEGEYYSAKDEDDSNELTWFDDKRGIVFHINSTLNKDEIIKMAHYVRIISQNTNE